jgi:sigma-B regulation protein RsbU (phosphoserine phosphatase)
MNWVVGSSRFSNKNAPSCCAILSSSGEVSFSNAGLNPLLLYAADNTVTECNTGGLPIGADRHAKYESKTIHMHPGSTGLLYSKGLISAVNNAGKTYPLERIKSIISSSIETSPAELIKNIENDLQNFLKEKQQDRDINAIIFKLQ